MEDKRVQSNTYGQPIPICYGTIRVAGQTVWSSELIEASEEVGGKGGSDGATIYRYSVNTLTSVCEGPIGAVLRIWGNGRLLWVNDGSGDGQVDKELLQPGSVRIYLGTEDQLPDPTYEAAVGSENAVAYRGQVVVAIDGLQLEPFGNRPPSLEFEVAQYAQIEGGECITPNPTEIGALYGAPEAGRFHSAYNPNRQHLYVIDSENNFGTKWGFSVYDVSGDSPTRVAWIETGSMVDNPMGGNRFPFAIACVPSRDEIIVFRDHGSFTDQPVFRVYDGESLTIKRYASSVAPNQNFPYFATYNPTRDTLSWWGGNQVFAQRQIFDAQNGTLEGTGPNGYAAGYCDCTGANDAYIPFASTTADESWNVWRMNKTTDVVGSTVTGPEPVNGFDTAVPICWDSNRRRVYVLRDKVLGIIDYDTDPDLISETIDLAALWMTAENFGGSRIDAMVYMEDADYVAIFSREFGTTPTSGIAYVNPQDFSLIQLCRASGFTSVPATEAGELHYMGDGKFCGPYQTGDVGIWYGATLGGSAIGEPVTLQSIVEDLCERSGLPAENLDASAGTDLVLGYKVARPSSARACIDQLRPGYFFDMVESGMQIVLRKRGAAAVRTIDAGDLGAVTFQLTRSDPEPAYELEHIEESEAPRELSVKWIDASANYDPGYARAARQAVGSMGIAEVEIPVVFNGGPDEAQAAAWVNLLHAHASKDPIKISLSHAHNDLEGGDAINVPLSHGLTVRVRCEVVNRARPLVEIEGVLEDAEIYDKLFNGVPREQGPRQPTLGELAQTILAMLDVPPLRDEDDSLLLYVAMGPDRKSAVWPGASLFKSADEGVSYSSVLSTSSAVTVGTTVGALADWTGGNRWDDENTVDVVLTYGSFSSATDIAVLNGANALAIRSGTDWEIVQFANAELVGTDTWRLSRLLRGRKGTERCMAGHSAADRVVLLTSSMRIHAPASAEIGAGRAYKGVTGGTAVSDADAQVLTLVGRSLMPLSPAHVQAVRDTTNDITVSWFRRARINANWPWDGSDIPLDEPTEAYEVEILDGSTVVRTLAVGSTSALYTQAQQLVDFGSLPDTLNVRVYQLSTRIGRGWPGTGALGLPRYTYEPGEEGSTPPGGSLPTPPAADRLFSVPMWWDGKWWAAPSNEVNAVDLGDGDQYAVSAVTKWAANKYLELVQVSQTGGGTFYQVRRGNKGCEWVGADGDILGGIFRNDLPLVDEFTLAEGNRHIQWWSPSWTGPKFARRGSPGAGEGNWYPASLVSKWGPAASTEAYLESGATDGTTWAFLVEYGGEWTIVHTTDFVAFTEQELTGVPGYPTSLIGCKLMHSGSEWVLFHAASASDAKISTSADLATWSAESDPPWSGIFSINSPLHENVALWNGDWYYWHDHSVYGVQVYKSADLVSWSLVHTATAPASTAGRMVFADDSTGGKLQRASGEWVIGTSDGTTFSETRLAFDGLEEMTRGLACPFVAQTLPGAMLFATQGRVGEGGALVELDDLTDSSPAYTYQPITTYGAGTVIGGSRTVGEIKSGGRVAEGFNGQVLLLKAFTSGKRYFEVEIISGVSGSTVKDTALRVGIDGRNSAYSAAGGVRSSPTTVLWASGPALNDGDVVGIAADFDANEIRIYRNGALFAPRAGLGLGDTVPISTADMLHTAYIYSGTGSVNLRVNARAADLQHSPPAGYTAWDD